MVHGFDSELKTDVERFRHEILLEPVVLHRQLDVGATIIEKFEQHADVRNAFVLLTPDDVAYTVDQENVPEDQRTTERRARPNVIFEFGYFVGKLRPVQGLLPSQGKGQNSERPERSRLQESRRLSRRTGIQHHPRVKSGGLHRTALGG